MAMTITYGLVRETLPKERRVALVPDGAERLISQGHSVLIETGAGVDAGFDDSDYSAVGATVCLSNIEVGLGSDVLIKLHSPNEGECDLLREGGTLMGFLHLFSPQASLLRKAIRTRKANALSFDLIEENDGSRPVLEAMSAIGGRVSVLLAAKHMLASEGGPGRLFGGAPGVPPMRVVIIGAGAAGEAAAKEAHNMGAQVTVLDQDTRALNRVATRIEGIVTAIASGPYLNQMLALADLLICAVSKPGHPAPRIVSRRHVRNMPPGSMIIDMSVDEGGCCETTRAHAQEDSYVEEGVRHLCMPNLPSEVARTASIAFSNAILPYLCIIGSAGIAVAMSSEPALYRAAVYVDGTLRNSVVAKLTGEPLGS
jgi:alanine dehydrogenase